MNKRTVISSFFIVIILFSIIGISFLTFYILKSDGDTYPYLNRVVFTLGGREIDDFGYILQDIDIDEVRNSRYDLMVLDYSSDGDELNEFSPSNVSYMQSSGEMEKYLLAYLSIGEAESYRFYWNNSWDNNMDGIPDPLAPEWLYEENPEWEGNYKVKYWDAQWQTIVYEYLDRIIAQGFDGIYMDMIDTYEYFESTVNHSDWLMIDFVSNISSYVKTVAGMDFFVFPQGGDNLLLNSTYLTHIDGIGREDVFYYDNAKTDSAWRNEVINNLNYLLALNKPVLVTDYPTIESKIYDSYQNNVFYGFIPYCSIRDLNNLFEYSFYKIT